MKTPVERQTVITIVVAVVLLAAIFIVWAISTTWQAPAPGTNPMPQAQTPTPEFAAKGQVVQGFPQNLILKDNPNITNSYTINYSSSTNLYTAQWNSSSTPDSVVSQYQTFLSQNGWSVTLTKSTVSWLKGLSAVTSTANLLLSVTPQGSGSQVSLTYTTQ